MLILVADEDKEYAEITAELMRHAGYEVVTEESASSAIRTAKIRRPDVVMLSVTLSSGLGRQVCAELTARDPDLPVVLLSNRRRPEDVTDAFDAGAADYITKPFHPQELTARVGSLAARRAAITGAEESYAA